MPDYLGVNERQPHNGRLDHFNTAEVIEFEKAGHWLHHDQFDRFMETLREFL